MVTGGRIVRMKMRQRDKAGDEHQNSAEQRTDATRPWRMARIRTHALRCSVLGEGRRHDGSGAASLRCKISTFLLQ